MLLQLLAIVLLIPAVCTACYYVVLAVVGMIWRSNECSVTGRPRHRFVILIPAHNEASIIASMIYSCIQLDYPKAGYRIVVVADNCDDATAAEARAAGATCLERRDDRLRGKGHALAWAIPQLLASGVDAVVVLDADCRLDPHALRIFDRELTSGSRILQASYVCANPDASAVSYLAAVANLLENDLYYAPKARLGLAILLRGTGMVFHREVLERVPWQAHSIVEDAEQTVRLYQAGYPVRFLPGVCVTSDFPERTDQLQVQRSRWIGGQLQVGLKWFLPLVGQGLRRGQWALLDLAWTLWATMRSLVVIELLAAWLVSLLCVWLVPGTLSRNLLAVAFGVVGLGTIYFGLGVLRMGLDWRRAQLLGRSSPTLARVMGIAAGSVLPGQNRGWVRTPR